MPEAAAEKPQPRKVIATVPPQEILPITDSNFESSVKGIYVIGDVTGLPLVKVASNHGVELLEKMERQRAFSNNGNGDDRLDLAIIGAGPAGLSAALEAEKRGLKYIVLERDRAGSTVRSFPPGKKVYAEPRFLKNISDIDSEGDKEKGEFVAMIEHLIEDRGIKIKEQTEVSRVVKKGERRFEVETEDGKSFPARSVVVAVGRQGQPRLLDVPGADNSEKVTYRLHTADDYHDKEVLVVGGGNSAIEAALMLMDHNRVTLSYRGDNFFRAKEDNRKLLEEAERDGKLEILYNSNVNAIHEDQVDIEVDGEVRTIDNDNVLILIGTLPPVDFLLDMGLELDGVWNAKRVVWSVVGIGLAIAVYFYSKYLVLLPEDAGEGKWLVSGLSGLAGADGLWYGLQILFQWALPIGWLVFLGVHLLNINVTNKGRDPLVKLPAPATTLTLGAMVYLASLAASFIFTVDPAQAGPGPYHLPGFEWMYAVIPGYFSNLYGFYYLLYFSAIAGFGLYWAWRYNHRRIWIRNLTIIVTQWTLWWGIPTFLAVFLGRNPFTPAIARSLNAWPLNMTAFKVDPVVGVGDPAWWHTVAVVGVVWAVLLTFVIIPIVTIKWGKIYCSYVCSCGGLAETVGNSFRHRGPKGDLPRNIEKLGFVFVLLAGIATIADLMGFEGPFQFYNVWVGVFLAGALAIGLYPFLGQRIWCRMWCPLAFWMNFWGRWSQFKITPEKGKCIDCNVCNQYCQMGIDIRTRALQAKPVTLKDTPCVACGECVARCPMEILHFGKVPDDKPYKGGTHAGDRAVTASIHNTLDIPRLNQKCEDERAHKE